jgi:predicted cupin superfamily sugar epimerase
MSTCIPDLQYIIATLNLQRLPFEGGWYAQSYKSKDMLCGPSLPERYPGPRALGTAIYYLMTAEQDGFSALHRLRGDEVLHFYLGDPINSLLIYPDGSFRKFIMGPNIQKGQVLQMVIPAGTWQGHRVCAGKNYALIGSTMTPGYDDEDFELGSRSDLCKQFPLVSNEITSLTRS